VNDKTWSVLTVSDEIEAIIGYPAADSSTGRSWSRRRTPTTATP
jgi:hypothetical protein